MKWFKKPRGLSRLPYDINNIVDMDNKNANIIKEEMFGTRKNDDKNMRVIRTVRINEARKERAQNTSAASAELLDRIKQYQQVEMAQMQNRSGTGDVKQNNDIEVQKTITNVQQNRAVKKGKEIEEEPEDDLYKMLVSG